MEPDSPATIISGTSTGEARCLHLVPLVVLQVTGFTNFCTPVLVRKAGTGATNPTRLI